VLDTGQCIGRSWLYLCLEVTGHPDSPAVSTHIHVSELLDLFLSAATNIENRKKILPTKLQPTTWPALYLLLLSRCDVFQLRYICERSAILPSAYMKRQDHMISFCSAYLYANASNRLCKSFDTQRRIKRPASPIEDTRRRHLFPTTLSGTGALLANQATQCLRSLRFNYPSNGWDTVIRYK
jgi:hypothetical protein